MWHTSPSSHPRGKRNRTYTWYAIESVVGRYTLHGRMAGSRRHKPKIWIPAALSRSIMIAQKAARNPIAVIQNMLPSRFLLFSASSVRALLGTSPKVHSIQTTTAFNYFHDKVDETSENSRMRDHEEIYLLYCEGIERSDLEINKPDTRRENPGVVPYQCRAE